MLDFDFAVAPSYKSQSPRYSAHTNGGAHFIGARKTNAQAEAVVTALALDSLRRYGSGTVGDIAERLDCSPDVARRVLERLVVHNAARKKETRDGALYIAVREGSQTDARARVFKRTASAVVVKEEAPAPFPILDEEPLREAIIRYFTERGGEATAKELYLAFGSRVYPHVAATARSLAGKGFLNRRVSMIETAGGLQPVCFYSLRNASPEPELRVADVSSINCGRVTTSPAARRALVKAMRASDSFLRIRELSERTGYSIDTCRVGCVMLARAGKVRAYLAAGRKRDYFWEALVSENEL